MKDYLPSLKFDIRSYDLRKLTASIMVYNIMMFISNNKIIEKISQERRTKVVQNFFKLTLPTFETFLGHFSLNQQKASVFHTINAQIIING